MAGLMGSFNANVDYAYGRGTTDLASTVQRGASIVSSMAMGANKITKEARQASRSVQDMASKIQQLRIAIANATDPKQIMRLSYQVKIAGRKMIELQKQMSQIPFAAMERGIGRVVKGLVSMNTALLSMSFKFVADSLKRVYELQERWTRAIGGFNLRLGGMTAGLKGAQRAAVAWSSTIRGLTDGDINEGIQMFGDFTDAIGRVVERGDQFQKFGVQLARGFNLGGAGAGQLTKVFENVGNNASSAENTMMALVKGARIARIPVNLLAKDIQDSSVWMARFGKEGQKTFVTGAAYVRQYTISMEQLRASVEGLDMFDEAARTASKLNVAFGTMINSMDLMLEDDPAKRLEVIRQQFLAQGTTFDRLTPKQRRYLSESLKLTEDQTAALLSSANAGKSYADFQEKAAIKEKRELTAKAMMEKQLRATTQTMYAFGVAFDRITLAIANAIRPMLEVFGLARSGDKDFKSFGQVMESITKTVERFFNSLSTNDRWRSFMKELATDVVKLGKTLRDFVYSGGASDLIGDVTVAIKDFYGNVKSVIGQLIPAFKPLLNIFVTLTQNIEALVVAWAGLKVFNAVGGVPTAVAGFNKIKDSLPSKQTMGSVGNAIGKGAGHLRSAGIGAAAGYAIGGTGAGIGAGVGSLAASAVLGPVLGPMVGSLVGGMIGAGIEELLQKKKTTDALAIAQSELTEIVRKQSAVQESYKATVELFQQRQKSEDIVRKHRHQQIELIERAHRSSREKMVTLTREEAETISLRARELALFSKTASVTESMLKGLGAGSKLTREQLNAIAKSSRDYESTLSNLRVTSEQILQQENAKLAGSRLGSQKMGLEAIVKSNEAFVAAGKASLKAQGAEGVIKKAFPDLDKLGIPIEDIIEMRDQRNRFDSMGVDKGDPAYKAAAAAEREFNQRGAKLSRKEFDALNMTLDVRKRELENVKLGKQLALLQTDFIEQQTRIQLRAIEMGSTRFMEFMARNPQIKNQGEALTEYIKENEKELVSLYGASGYELLKTAPSFGIPKMAQGGIVSRPTVALIGEAGPEAVVPLKRHNYASNNVSNGSQQVVTSIADIQLDGEKVGRAIVRTALTGRN